MGLSPNTADRAVIAGPHPHTVKTCAKDARGGDDGHREGCLRVESVRDRTDFTSLLPSDDISTHKLSTPCNVVGTRTLSVTSHKSWPFWPTFAFSGSGQAVVSGGCCVAHWPAMRCVLSHMMSTDCYSAAIFAFLRTFGHIMRYFHRVSSSSKPWNWPNHAFFGQTLRYKMANLWI